MTKPASTAIIDPKRKYYWSMVRKYCERNRNFSWSSSELILNLVYTYHTFHSTLTSRVLSRFNLSDSAMNILMILHLSENRGYKQQELSSLLLVSRANVTKVIDGLEERGLVIRDASKEDRRARVIKLTPQGTSLARQTLPLQNENCVRATKALSKTEISTLNTLLAKLAAIILESEKANE